MTRPSPRSTPRPIAADGSLAAPSPPPRPRGRRIALGSALALAIGAAVAAAQAPADEPPRAAPEAGQDSSRVTADAVRETLEFLASDALLGRDTPSEGLSLAAEYIAARFAAAGLEPLAGESFLIPYSAGGVRHDLAGMRVTARVGDEEVALEPGADVRVWSASDAFSGADVALRRISEDDPELAAAARARDDRPLLVEVADDSPLWTSRPPGREEVAGRRRRPRPLVLLVRAGLLPDGDVIAALEVPAPTQVELELHNVGALRRGAARPDEVVLYGAHYDHIGVQFPRDGDAVMNGADDDASGTTAVVLLAERFGALPAPRDRSVAFLCFSGEEKGLLGSRAFCEAPPFPLDRIVAMLNVEMIGRPHEDVPGRAWITGPAYSDLRDLVARPFAAAGVELIDFPMQDRLYRASDNAPFASAGVVAHSVSAGSLHDDYHGPNDEVDRIDVEHMARVIHALMLAGDELAGGETRPAWTEAGRAAAGLDR